MKNPLLQNSVIRVNRGGSWWDRNAGYTRVSLRFRSRTSSFYDFRGFRLFRTREKS